MDFHLINEKNLAKVESLWDYCFEKKDSYFFKWYFKEYCLKQNAVLGGFNKQGVLSTMVHLNPYTLKLRGMEAVTSYLVGVATDPAARGRQALSVCNARGLPGSPVGGFQAQPRLARRRI